MYIMLDGMYVTVSISTGLYWIYGPQINYNYDLFIVFTRLTRQIQTYGEWTLYIPSMNSCLLYLLFSYREVNIVLFAHNM